MQIPLSGICGAEGQTAPVKQRYASLLLDLPQHLTERGLADIQLFGRGGNSALLRNGFHVQSLP